MHFLDVDKNKNIPRWTFLMSFIFVLTGAFGVGGFIQQLLSRYFHVIPTLDLRDLSILSFVKLISFQSIPFVTGILAILFAVNRMLGRSVLTLFGENEGWLKKIGFAGILFFALFLVINVSIDSWDGRLQFNHLSSDFFVFATCTFLFLIIQVSFEEVFFRSFLPQILVGNQLSKLLAISISAILFGLLHVGNPEIDVYGGWMLGLYVLQGFFLGILTLMDRSLWLAFGYHFANNLLVLVLVSNDNQVLKVPSIFSSNSTNTSVFIFVLQTVMMIIIFFVACYRKYNWSFSKLTD